MSKFSKNGRPKSQHYQRTQAEYAALLGVTERTIRRWQRDGAPMDDYGALDLWVSVRSPGLPQWLLNVHYRLLALMEEQR